MRAPLIRPAAALAGAACLLAIAAAACLLSPAGARAQSRSLVIERMDVELRVQPDATTHVTERFRIRFDGEWNGLRRVINIGFYDSDQRLTLEGFRATDPNGRELRTDVERNGAEIELRIWVPGARDATREVALHYRVVDGLRFFTAADPDGEHDQLYWSATGNAWEVPILEASATVFLPPGAREVRAAAYTGPYGSQASDAEISVEGEVIRYRARSRMDPGEGLTVVAGWGPGLVDRSAPSVQRATRPGPPPVPGRGLGSSFPETGPLGRYWPLLLPFLAFYAMYRLWRRHGDDPEVAIAARYEPPAGLTPGEVAYVGSESASTRIITATLVDLAVRGHLGIEEYEKEGFLGIGSSTKYAFVRRTGPAEWAALKPHESELLAGLFGAGGYKDRVEMEDLKGEFYKTAAEVKEEAQKGVSKAGHWRREPTVVRLLWVAAAVGVCGLLVPAGLMLRGFGVVGSIPVWFVSLAGVFLSMVGFGLAMPIRTQRGLSAYAQTLGFKEFLSRVESDRYERTMLTPETFDRYLPFAMALGVEERWAEKFEGIAIPPPEWYHGASHAHFTPRAFVQSLDGCTRAASHAMAPPSSSSSGSGFSGGFSGGGGGGGGGGGF